MQAELQGWDVAPGHGGCMSAQGPPRLTSKIGSEEKLGRWLSTVCPVSLAIRLATLAATAWRSGSSGHRDDRLRGRLGLLSRIWVRDHWNGGWITVFWTQLHRVAAPFGELAWDHARKLLPGATEAGLAGAVEDLLTRAGQGPGDGNMPGPAP